MDFARFGSCLGKSSRPAAAHGPTDELDRAAEGEGQPEREAQPLPGCMLEGATAEVPEQRRVERPDERGHGIEDRESTPGIPHRSGAQRDSRPPARNEPTDQDQLGPAVGKLPASPFATATCRLASEPGQRARAEPSPDEI